MHICVCSVAQLSLTLCYLWTVCSPPGSSVQEILQTRILEWAAIPSPGCLPNPGTEAGSPALQAGSFPSKPPGKRQG